MKWKAPKSRIEGRTLCKYLRLKSGARRNGEKSSLRKRMPSSWRASRIKRRGA